MRVRTTRIRPRWPSWLADPLRGPAVVGAGGALSAAVVSQAIALLEPAGWSWTALLKDLVTNVFLAGLVGLLVEGSRRLARQRSTSSFIAQTSPLVEKAVLAWGGELARASFPSAGTERTRMPAFAMAEFTLNEIEQGLRRAIGSANAEAFAGQTLTPSTIRELGRYLQDGGRRRRAVYAQALMTELAAARIDGEGQVAAAASSFISDATEWLALLRRTDAAIHSLASESALIDDGADTDTPPPVAVPAGIGLDGRVLLAALRVGEDPAVALLRSLRRISRGLAEPPTPAQLETMDSLRQEAVAAFRCVGDLRDLFAAAADLGPRAQG